MIQETELRIGNIVRRDKDSNEPYTIIQAWEIEQSNYGLPITENLLLKFGAVHDLEAGKNEMGTIYQLDTGVVDALSNPVIFEIRVFTTGYLPDEIPSKGHQMFWIRIGGIQKEINSVHQLQNIVFALTGEELEITV